jgi:hypothetical protein
MFKAKVKRQKAKIAALSGITGNLWIQGIPCPVASGSRQSKARIIQVKQV